jgi:Membrane proteins related to metalloendopeptidases
MEIILLSSRHGKSWRRNIEFRRWTGWLPHAALATGVFAALLAAGFGLGRWTGSGPASGVPVHVVRQWNANFRQQAADIAQAKLHAQADAHALARKIAQIQADVMRLDAAGQRMTQIAGIKSDEFDFAKPAPMGGPEDPPITQPPVMEDVMQSLDELQHQLANRERQMHVLEDILLSSRLQKEVRPAGWPVDEGYISSGFGMRTDPFTGLRAFHPGIDFAAPAGTPVQAVAAGIVTHAGPDAGYGNMVEINHGNGYATLYGHNEKILVHVGERVKRGQDVALVGSTGRSTGPHCHLGVLHDGKFVNPERYIQASR